MLTRLFPATKTTVSAQMLPISEKIHQSKLFSNSHTSRNFGLLCLLYYTAELLAAKPHYEITKDFFINISGKKDFRNLRLRGEKAQKNSPLRDCFMDSVG